MSSTNDLLESCMVGPTCSRKCSIAIKDSLSSLQPQTSNSLVSLPPWPSLCRYEWVDVGMLEYNPASKLYLVKRVHVPSHIAEEAASRQRDADEKGT